MIQFLANENIPIGSIKLLRKSGYDVLSILEEMPGAKDSDILKIAYDENRIILTFDRDYGELIYRYKSYPPGGIVYFRFEPSDPEEPSKIL
jgi:predicted nuclease of predicted toxin-antitoxin system